MKKSKLYTLWTVVGIALTVIGLGGIRDDLRGWSNAIGWVYTNWFSQNLSIVMAVLGGFVWLTPLLLRKLSSALILTVPSEDKALSPEDREKKRQLLFTTLGEAINRAEEVRLLNLSHGAATAQRSGVLWAIEFDTRLKPVNPRLAALVRSVEGKLPDGVHGYSVNRAMKDVIQKLENVYVRLKHGGEPKW